jgi:hypothetical protein
MPSETPSHLPVLDVMLNTFVAQALRVVVQGEIPDLLAEQPPERAGPDQTARSACIHGLGVLVRRS